MWFGWVFKVMTRQSCQPVYSKKPFNARSVVGFEVFFVADHTVLGDVFVFLRLQPGSEGADVADVFVDGVLGFFLCIDVIFV